MSHQDQFGSARKQLERVLEILDAAAGRLEGGGTLPARLLADAVEFVRTFEEAAYEASQTSDGEPPLSACVEQHIAARAPMRGMQQALARLDAGESAARGHFARSAREYAALCREHIRQDDRLFLRARRSARQPPSPINEQPGNSPALQRIYDRLLESAVVLTTSDTPGSRTRAAEDPAC